MGYILMKYESSFIRTFFFVVSLLLPTLLQASLVEGTLVKTPQGLLPVEQLRVGDIVFSYESVGILKEVKILYISKETTDIRLIIPTEEGIVIACKDQFFYDIETCRWIQAEKINGDQVLVNCHGKPYQCRRVITVHESTTIYKVTVEFPHTLFISEMEIVTHN